MDALIKLSLKRKAVSFFFSLFFQSCKNHIRRLPTYKIVGTGFGNVQKLDYLNALYAYLSRNYTFFNVENGISFRQDCFFFFAFAMQY